VQEAGLQKLSVQEAGLQQLPAQEAGLQQILAQKPGLRQFWAQEAAGQQLSAQETAQVSHHQCAEDGSENLLKVQLAETEALKMTFQLDIDVGMVRPRRVETTPGTV
jgi:hypothetical protein